MVSSAPILKRQTSFLRELTHFQRIQPVPDDLSILAHTVSIYWPAYSTPCFPDMAVQVEGGGRDHQGGVRGEGGGGQGEIHGGGDGLQEEARQVARKFVD